MNERQTDGPLISTGIPGLDDVLSGGLDPDRLYLIEGEPGTGKTTIALQFLLEGASRGEKGLCVTLSESERELRLVASAMAGPSTSFPSLSWFLPRLLSIRSGNSLFSIRQSWSSANRLS